MSSADRVPCVQLTGEEKLTSAMISDSLDLAGLRSQVFDRRLAPLTPGSSSFGWAWTVKFEPSTDDSSDELCGVEIRTGDVVIADDDGVVVIPQEGELEVLTRARDRAAKESTVLSELLAGETLRTVWDRHGIL